MAARAHRRCILLVAGALACTPNPGASKSTPAPAAMTSTAAAEVASAAPDEPARAPEPAPAPVELVVRAPSGAAIAGATVRYSLASTREERTHITDARGLAVVPGGASLAIEAPGFVPLTGARAGPSGTTELHLLPGSTLVGRVVDPRGQPVVGAEVAIDGGAGRVMSGADGRFRVEGLAPGRRLLTIRGQGVLADRLVAVGLAEAQSLEIEATKAATIEARAIFAESGEPCSGGTVTLYIGREGPSDGCPVCGGAEPTVDAPIAADGRVRIEVAPGLVYGVEVACFGAMKGTPEPVFVGDVDVTGLRWQAPRGQQLRGTVVDDQGRPRPGIEVFLRSADTRLHEDNGDRSTSTDEDGRFELMGIGDGQYDVELFSEDLRDIEYSGEASLTVAERDLEGLVFVVRGEPRDDDDDDDNHDRAAASPTPEPRRVRGVVVDARGAPIADALVIVSKPVPLHQALELLARAWDGGTPTRSDVAGGFETQLPALDDEGDDDAAPPVILAHAPGGAVGLAEVRSTDAPIELRVRPLANFTGRVRDRRAQPITHLGLDLGRGRPRQQYIHAPGGTFAIPGLLPGEYRLRLFGPDGVIGGRIEVPANRAPAPVTFTSRGELDRLSINLDDVVTHHDPVGCKVVLRPFVGPRRTGVVDNRGWVEFAQVAAGPAQLQVLPCTVGGRRHPAQTGHLRLRPDHDIAFVALASHDAALTGRGGDLGYTLAPRRASLDPLLQPLRVRSLRGGGPAERGGLRVGDEIVEIDGHQVEGRRTYLHEGLTRVAPGTSLQLGLADGRTIALVAE